MGTSGIWVLLGAPTGVAAAPARRELCACAKNGSGLLRGTGLVGTGSGHYDGALTSTCSCHMSLHPVVCQGTHQPVHIVPLTVCWRNL